MRARSVRGRRPASSASTSRIDAARVTAGASDSPALPSPVSVVASVDIADPSRHRRPSAAASLLAGVLHLDYARVGMVYCPAYRRRVQYVGRRRTGQEEGQACSRGSDRSRQRSFPFSCWRPAARRRHQRPRLRRRPVGSRRRQPAQSAAPSTGRRIAGHEVRRRQRQHPDLQRPAGRGAAPASGSGLGEADRRSRQRGRRRLPDDLRQGPARRVDRARTRSTGMSSIHSGWATSSDPGYLLDLTDREKNDPQLDQQDIVPFFRDYNSVYNGKNYTIPLDGDFHMVYYRSDLLDEGRPQAAGDLGRLPRDRPEVQRPGPQRRRPARLRLVHRQEEGRPELLVDHLDRRRPAPEPRARARARSSTRRT